MDEFERFDKYVQKTETCWLWTGQIDKKGYGRFYLDGSWKNAHRVMFELVHDLPKHLLVLHKCDVRHCVNPDHLFAGTAQENTDDMIKKGRAGIKSRHNAKLTDEQVRAMLKENEDDVKVIAKKYNVSVNTVWGIFHRRTYKHITTNVQLQDSRPEGKSDCHPLV